MTVFSDLHFGENPWDSWGPEQDSNSTRLMKTVLKSEKPDYVVINGDLITGKNTFRALIDEIVAPLNAAKIPFSSSHGNHYNQVNITHAEQIIREQKVASLSYTRMAPWGVGGVGGPGNYWVPIYHKKADESPVLILWFFDSQGGVSTNATTLPEWVDNSVAVWIKTKTEVMEAIWGSSENRGALAFVHIPPYTFFLVNNLNSDENPGLNADSLDGGGSVQATTIPSNFGKDDTFWNSVNANIKNLHAVISGHDDIIEDFEIAFSKLEIPEAEGVTAAFVAPASVANGALSKK
ncbi:hypothetical protein C0991_000367 [Blastosporella zonata]|nr:hypothetical protein C0991_000367 [Blastosporella zonata]